MNNVKFTSKCESLIATAAETAQESQHQQLTPIHLAIAIVEDPEGIAKQATIKVCRIMPPIMYACECGANLA
jgi:ATP-dependent Clp protease ATP-binding subunit ClpB